MLEKLLSNVSAARTISSIIKILLDNNINSEVESNIVPKYYFSLGYAANFIKMTYHYH